MSSPREIDTEIAANMGDLLGVLLAGETPVTVCRLNNEQAAIVALALPAKEVW